MALWQEFLSGFFDGANHDLDALNHGVTFPAATLEFSQSRVPQPLDGAIITVIGMSPGRARDRWDLVGDVGDRHVGKVAALDVTWMFWVRAKVSGVGASGWLASQVASRLYGLLGNRTAVAPLAGKGIYALRPDSPVTFPDSDYAMRLVACRCRLNFALSVQDL